MFKRITDLLEFANKETETIERAKGKYALTGRLATDVRKAIINYGEKDNN